jgi:exopolysaccharide production protein ExoZ
MVARAEVLYSLRGDRRRTLAEKHQTESFQSVQFLRFVAALLVVIFHAHVAQSRFTPGGQPDATDYYFSAGAIGVHIFFVVSGFVMAHTSLDKFARSGATGTFLIRRICRIFPPYWIYAALYVLVHSIGNNPYQLSVPIALQSALLLPGGSASIIGPGWTLSYEIYFYLCFGLALMLPRWIGLFALTAIFLATIAVGAANGISTYIPFNPLLLEFLAGVWAAVYVKNATPSRMPTGRLCIAGALILFTAGIIFGYDKLPSVVVWGIPSAILVFGMVQLDISGNLPGFIKRLSFLGDSSYSLYLLHILLIHIAITWSLKSGLTCGNEFADLAVITILCIFVSLYAHRLVELPATRLARQITSFSHTKWLQSRTA